MKSNKLIIFGFLFAILTASLVFGLTDYDFQTAYKNVVSKAVVSSTDYVNSDLKWFSDGKLRTQFLANSNDFDWSNFKGKDSKEIDLSSKKILLIADSSDWKSAFKATTLATNIKIKSKDKNELNVVNYEGFNVVHEGDYYPVKKLLENGNFDVVLAFGNHSFCENTTNKQSFFASNKNETVYCMNNTDYINRWSSKNNFRLDKLFVISENNYDAAIIASTIASTLNAPLLINGVDKFTVFNDSENAKRLSLKFGEQTYFLTKIGKKPTPNVKIITVVNDQSFFLTDKFPTSDVAILRNNLINNYNSNDDIVNQTILQINTNPNKLYSFQTKMLSYERSFGSFVNPGDIKSRTDDHLIVYNPKDINNCSNKYSEYLKETSGLSNAPSTFCKDSLVVPYFAAIRGGILMPLRGDADVLASNFNADLSVFLEKISKNNDFNTDLTKSFFNLESKTSNILINSLRSLFVKQKKFNPHQKPDELFVSVIGNPYTVPFFYNDKFFQINTEPYLLASGNISKLSDDQKLFWSMTKVGWITGLTTGDTSALVTKNFFTGYTHVKNTLPPEDDSFVVGRFYDNGIRKTMKVGLATTTSSDFRFTDPFVWQDLSNFKGEHSQQTDFFSITPIFIERSCNSKTKSIQVYSKEVNSKDVKNNDGISYLDSFSLDIKFDNDKAIILPSSAIQLLNLVQDWNDLAQKVPSVDITVNLSANTDADGSIKYNQDLSKRRGDAVAKFLTDSGFKGKINVFANGELNPKVLTQKDIDTYLNQYVDAGLIFEPGYNLTQKNIETKTVECNSIKTFSKKDCAFFRKEVLMRLNRRVDFDVSIKAPSVKAEVKDGTTSYQILLPQQEIKKTDDCTETVFNYFDYDIFYYLGEANKTGGLKGLPSFKTTTKSKNNLMFFETDANLLDFDSDKPPLALKFLREGSRGIYISSSNNSKKANQGQFFLSTLNTPFENNLKTGELSSALFMNYIRWMPPRKNLDSCAKGLSCETSSLLDRARDKYDNKFRLLGDPLSTVMYQRNFNGEANLIPVEKTLENPRPMILFSAIDESDVAFLNSFNKYVNRKSMKEGVFEWWNSSENSDFSVQSNIIPVLANGKSPKATILVASNEPVYAQASLIDLSVDGCIEDVHGSTVFKTPSEFKLKLQLPGIKFNKFKSSCPYQSFKEKIAEKNAKSNSGYFKSLSVGTANFKLSYTPSTVRSFGSETNLKKSKFEECTKASNRGEFKKDDFKSFLDVDNLDSLDLYICKVDVPSLSSTASLVHNSKNQEDIFYKDALVRFEVVDRKKSKINTFSASSTLRLRYVYDLDSLNSMSNKRNSPLELNNALQKNAEVNLGDFVRPNPSGTPLIKDGVLSFKLTTDFTGKRIIVDNGKLNTGYEVVDFVPTNTLGTGALSNKLSDYWRVSNPFYYGGSSWFRGSVVTADTNIPIGKNLSSFVPTNLGSEKQKWFDSVNSIDNSNVFPNFDDSILASLMQPDKLSQVDLETYYPYDVAALVWLQSDVFDDGSLIIDIDFENNSFYSNSTGEMKPNILTERIIKKDINDRIKQELDSKFPDMTNLEKNALVSNYMAVTIYPRFKLASTKLFSNVSKMVNSATGLGTVSKSMNLATYLNLGDLSPDKLIVDLSKFGLDKTVPIFEIIDSAYFLTEDEYNKLNENVLAGYSGANSGEQHFVSLMKSNDATLNCYSGDSSRFRGGYTYVLPTLSAVGNDLGLETSKATIYVS